MRSESGTSIKHSLFADINNLLEQTYLNEDSFQ